MKHFAWIFAYFSVINLKTSPTKEIKTFTNCLLGSDILDFKTPKKS